MLDAPLAEYVPQFAAVKPATADSKPVTVRDLLCHVAGFVTDDPWGDRVLGMTPAGLDEVIATGTLFARAPGLAYEYSNLGYALLGRVLTNVSGEPYQDYMRRLFLRAARHGAHDLRRHRGGARRLCLRLPPRRQDMVARAHRAGRRGRRHGRPGHDGAGLCALGRLPARGLAARATIPRPARSGARACARWRSVTRHPFSRTGRREPRPTAYGYGLMNTEDPRLGRVLHHPGGLPGYGSHVLMLPDRGCGRVRLRQPHLRADVEADAASGADPARRRAEASACRAVRRRSSAPSMPVVKAYTSGRIEDASPMPCARTCFSTRRRRLRNATLADLKRKLGEGTVETIEPTHALGGTFTLACARGRLKVTLILSPERQPGIQKLVFDVEGARDGKK